MGVQPWNSVDPCSLANLDDFKCHHLEWDIVVDFDARILNCTSTLHLKRQSETADTVVLDTSALAIKNVQINSKDVVYHVGEAVLPYGAPLTIKLPQDSLSKKDFAVDIKYSTTSDCTAVQWLTEQQTAGKKLPYLFTQCQAIHARSILPCQDSPAVKMTYNAKVTTMASVTSLMSAIRLQDTLLPSGQRQCSFKQEIPIPSYLLALAVGALEGRKVGPRSTVWCEKEFIDAAAYEFGEVESMIAAGESLLGPYVWHQYDLLILPPSFPYGGMENPCLTFVTPTTLAGDRSLTSLAVHEITHSWTGNLVTNVNWEHFWLNEGFTRFVEAKIIGILKGEKNRQFAAIEGWHYLEEAVKTFGSDNPLTSLVPKLAGVHPDDAFSSVPYEKGYAFLAYLESKLGGPDIFNPFLRAYIDKFKHQSISTDVFKAHLLSYFKDNASLDEVDWSAWLHSPGMPPCRMIDTYDHSLVEASKQLAKDWIRRKDAPKTDEHLVQAFKQLSPGQIVSYLKELANEDIPVALLDEIDAFYHLDASKNCEIKFRWLLLCLKSNRTAIFPSVSEFLAAQGRMKFVRPLYRAFYANENSRDTCLALFDSQKDSYHAIASKLIAKDLAVQ